MHQVGYHTGASTLEVGLSQAAMETCQDGLGIARQATDLSVRLQRPGHCCSSGVAHPQQQACTAGTCLQHRLNSFHLVTCWSQCKDDCNQEQGVSNCFDHDRALNLFAGGCMQCKGKISWRAPAFYGQRPRNFVTPLADILKDPLSRVFLSSETPGVSGNEARLPSLFCRTPTFHPHMPRCIQ